MINWSQPIKHERTNQQLDSRLSLHFLLYATCLIFRIDTIIHMQDWAYKSSWQWLNLISLNWSLNCKFNNQLMKGMFGPINRLVWNCCPDPRGWASATIFWANIVASHCQIFRKEPFQSRSYQPIGAPIQLVLICCVLLVF